MPSVHPMESLRTLWNKKKPGHYISAGRLTSSLNSRSGIISVLNKFHVMAVTCSLTGPRFRLLMQIHYMISYSVGTKEEIICNFTVIRQGISSHICPQTPGNFRSFVPSLPLLQRYHLHTSVNKIMPTEFLKNSDYGVRHSNLMGFSTLSMVPYCKE
jgi:hypothetical protein